MSVRLLFIFPLLFLAQLFGRESAPLKHTLSICAIFKNEAKFLKEWIAFHQLVGVDHFYLYDIESNDAYMKVVRPFVEKGVVTLKKWPNISGQREENDPLWALGTQIPAYENAIKVFASMETKWLVFVDTDEFLLSPLTAKITDILEEYKEECGVLLSEDYFDASVSGVPHTRNLIIEATTRVKYPEKPRPTAVAKMIFQPALCETFLWPPYTCCFKNNRQPVKIGRQYMRINRYLNRHMQKAADKIHLGNIYYSEQDFHWLLQANYQLEDPEKAIFRFLPDLLEKTALH